MWHQSTITVFLCLQFVKASTLANQRCVNASQISPGAFVVASTAGLSTVNTGSSDLDLLRCGEDGIFSVDSPGLWYFYREQAIRDLQASTCSNDTNFANRITVFYLEDGSCASRQCIASSAEDQENCDFGNGTSVRFSTTPGLYAIYVHGEDSEAVGTFGLSFLDDSAPPDGSSCEAALKLSHNGTIQGTTVGAEYHEGLICDKCIEGGPSNPGLYFRIPAVSSDMGISISLAGANDRLFDAKVYTGPCGEFECKMVKTTIKDNELTASWLAEEGESFYVYVSAADDGTNENVTDRFGILMIQEEKKSDDQTTASTASNMSWSVRISLGLLTILSIRSVF